MPTNPHDYIPSAPPLEKIGIYTLPPAWTRNQPKPNPPARRGGKRPRAGAKHGNLNALKHGRYSRFKELLPPEPFDPAVPARTLLVQQRTQAERIAASFFRVLLQARWQRDAANSIAEGHPVPPPPLVTPSRRDHARVLSFLEASNTLAGLDRFATTEGASPNPAALAEYRRQAEQLDEVLPVIALLLDRAAQPAATPQSLAALLRNEIGFNQSTPLPLESTARALAAIAESTSTTTRNSIQSTPPPTETPSSSVPRQGAPPTPTKSRRSGRPSHPTAIHRPNRAPATFQPHQSDQAPPLHPRMERGTGGEVRLTHPLPPRDPPPDPSLRRPSP